MKKSRPLLSRIEYYDSSSRSAPQNTVDRRECERVNAAVAEIEARAASSGSGDWPSPDASSELQKMDAWRVKGGWLLSLWSEGSGEYGFSARLPFRK